MAIDWKQMGEEFRFMSTGYDVDAAKRILATKKKMRVDMVKVSEVAPMVGPPPEPGKLLLRMVSVDWDKAKTDDVDLSIPLIFAYSAKGNLLPIDGYHRIAKAVLMGVESLPVVCLTKAESKRVWC